MCRFSESSNTTHTFFGALACVRANASDEEWAIIETETLAAEMLLQDVLRREGTQRCFAVNNVVVFI